MIWYDTLNSKLKVRNSANDAWNEVWQVGASMSAFAYTLIDDTTAAAARVTLGGADPPGVIKAYGGDTAPTGWLLCYGQAVSETTYADLFTVIGHKFGDPGGGNFNVPDMRGRLPLGADNMGGSSADRVTAAAADTIGSSGGAENHLHTTGDHTLTVTEMPGHTHSETGWDMGVSGYQGTGMGNASGATTGSTGGGAAHNHGNTGSTSGMNPYLTLNYIIKY
jgi:microcystin-dependent protein